MSKPYSSSKSKSTTSTTVSNNSSFLIGNHHHPHHLSNAPSSSSSSRINHSFQYMSIENPSSNSNNASFHSFQHRGSGATSPTMLNSTTLPSLTSPINKQIRSASPASFENQRPESPTYLPLGIGESVSSSTSSNSSSARNTNRTYNIGQRAPSVPADAFHRGSQRSLFESNAPTLVMTSTASSMRPPKSPISMASSSNNLTDTSSVVSSVSNAQSNYQPVAFDDETTLFVNIMKKDLGYIQKRINELKYEEKHNSQRSDDIGNFSNCIYQNDQYRTRYSLLELFVDKLAEMQQILMQKTDKLIPVSKRFKTNSYEKKVSIRLQRFAEVSDRIMDVVENNKPSSLSSSPKKEKVQTSNKETQTKDSTSKKVASHKETQDAEVNTDRVDKTPYEAEIQELKKLVRYLQLDKEQANKTIKDLSETVSSAHFDRQKEYDIIIGQLKKDIEKLKQEKMQILENQAATIESHRKADLQKIESQMKEKATKIENLESRLYFKGKEIEAIQDELDSLRSKSALQKEKDEAEVWKSKYQELERSRNDLERKYRDLIDECDLVKETLKKEELRHKETVETMREMQDHQNRLHSEASKQDTKKLQSKLEAAEKIAMQKEFQYEDLVKNYQIQSIELGISNKQNDNLKDQVKNLNREKQKLLENVAQEQNVDVKHEIDIIKRYYEEKSKTINEKMKDLQMGHVMQLKALNDTFTQERKMLQRKADKFKQRCDLLEARLEEMEKNR